MFETLIWRENGNDSEDGQYEEEGGRKKEEEGRRKRIFGWEVGRTDKVDETKRRVKRVDVGKRK